MSNVVQLKTQPRFQTREARIATLLDSFAIQRRSGDDVFWLKENAEILNILECADLRLDEESLASHEEFYASAEKRLAFFPQYYRFLLSITLDLEALGMPGDKATRMVDWACAQNLAHAELSDLQRMEARRLMARCGRDPLPEDVGLDDRIRAFIGCPQTFTLPNKKAAYELTHAVFYLSAYGRSDPQLDAGAKTSLYYAGLLAFLDQNADLLAEICIALRYAGTTPPAPWTDWLTAHTHGFTVTADEHASLHDDYHEFLVCNWHQSVTDAPIFNRPIGQGRLRFDRAPGRSAPLRELSECMYEMDAARSGDWGRMRPQVEARLSPDALDVLDLAEASCAHFGAFFEGFARADQGLLSA